MNISRRGLLRMAASLPFVGHLIPKTVVSPVDPYREAGQSALNAINHGPAALAWVDHKMQEAFDRMCAIMFEQAFMNGQGTYAVIVPERVIEAGGLVYGQFYRLPDEEKWKRFSSAIERKFDPKRLPA